jgi:RNAse (barnase) inhibitor barstar
MEFKKAAKMDARADMDGAPAPAPSREIAAPGPSGGKAGGAQAGEGKPEPAIAEPDDQPDDHGRQIIYTANMQVGVYNIQKAMEVAEVIPARVGGWVHTRSEGFITMKIPAKSLRSVMEELGALGNVLVRELQAQDVTAEYVDLESRIKVLRETQEQLILLLKKAKNVEEALHVRRALDEVTMQLETALGRMRQLQNAISFSTLTITFVEQGPHTDTPTSNDPFPWVDSLGVETTEWR